MRIFKKGFLLPIIIFLSACTTIFPSTSNSIPVLGQTPIYQGMIVESVTNNNSLSFGKPLGSSRQNSIDPTNPFNNPSGQRIEDFINVDLPIDPSYQPFAYYVQSNQEFLVRVQVYNPSQYEILSFTLNGEKYASFMFEDGSNLQNLILKVNSGSIPGPKDYTIDQIKYVDGTDIKDVVINGDQTITVGVLYPSTPSVSVTNLQFNSTAASFEVTTVDPYNILSNDYSKVKAYLFDGTSIVKNIDVTEPQQVVLFDSILANKLYQYVVVGTFDLMDGNGPQKVYFHNHTFITTPLFDVLNVVPTKTSVAFEITQRIFDKNLVINKVDLIKNNQVVSTKDKDNLFFDGLFTNNLYSVLIEYTYNISPSAGEKTDFVLFDFTTLNIPEPVISITDLNVGNDSLSFFLEGSFGDASGSITSLKLFKDESLVKNVEDLTLNQTIRIDNLLTNTQYYVELVYQYDLNDN
jgi:hypothetical protein